MENRQPAVKKRTPLSDRGYDQRLGICRVLFHLAELRESGTHGNAS